jgi:hypothetical protein
LDRVYQAWGLTACLWYYYLVMATLEELWRTFQRESAVYLDAQKALNEAVAVFYSGAHPDLDLVNQRRSELKRAHDSYHAALEALLRQKQ